MRLQYYKMVQFMHGIPMGPVSWVMIAHFSVKHHIFSPVLSSQTVLAIPLTMHTKSSSDRRFLLVSMLHMITIYINLMWQ